MNRSFVVPAAIALALHATLFVGSGQPPSFGGKKTDTRKDLDPPDKREVILLKEFEDVIKEEKALAKNEQNPGGGSGEEAPISLPELPYVGPVSPFKISQAQVPVTPGTGTKLPTGFTGFEKGDGEGLGSGIISSAFLDSTPVTRRQTPPMYPHSMKTQGVEGTVWVDFVVDENGRVNDVRVVKSTNDNFNEATLKAVASWRFEPGKRKGLPVRFRMTIPIVFNLSD